VVVVGKTEATQANGYFYLVRCVYQANLHVTNDVENAGTGCPGRRGRVACEGSRVVVVVG
jgi:hypothetical protein